MDFNAESGQKLAEAIDKRIIDVSNQLFNNSGRDKTVYGVVIKSNNGVFSIKVNNTEYHNVLALRSVGNISVGEKVTCLVPNGNYSDMIILGVADGTLQSGGGSGGEVYDGVLTIQRNGSTVGTFSANSQIDKIINISVPTTAQEVGALPSSTLYCASVDFSFDGTTYSATIQLKDQNGNNLSTAKTVTLPFSGTVVNGSFNSSTKMIVLETMGGQLIQFSIADLLTQVQTDITNLQNNKLDKSAVITPEEVDELFPELEPSTITITASYSSADPSYGGGRIVQNNVTLATISYDGTPVTVDLDKSIDTYVYNSYRKYTTSCGIDVFNGETNILNVSGYNTPTSDLELIIPAGTIFTSIVLWDSN